ncbi:hypothetical protein AMJ71_06525 [candidate division TA06 bacterium SM1_40]|uniref:Flippase-like domain-containing protein n=2 Tax=Bacteria division TA06 TaxID=1156500 RepID=A0A0S8JI66_UNCT6|nr:MAG: hypothetical protein AMJ82_01025 [candidate division TA06 bacterium SM23_40]KPL09399.1 MAG: hypothetical protein AMJ71_06525 [candidate division TA06 bacterium SM1_40]
MSWRRIAQVLLVSAAVIYIVQRIIADASKLLEFDWRLKLGSLAVSYLLLFAAFSGYPVVWWLLLRGMGERLPLGKAFRIWYVSNLGRYVPGKIWQIVGRVELAKDLGVARSTSAASVVYETGLIITSGIIVFGVATVASRDATPFSSVWPIFLVLPFGIVLAHPRVLSAVTNVVLRKVRKPEITLDVGLRWAASVLALYGILWIIQGAGFFFLVRSLTAVSFRWLPQLVGVFAAAWIAGFLSFITPGGLGVREGVMTFLLSLYLPPSISAVVSILSRIWITVGEVVCALVSSKA